MADVPEGHRPALRRELDALVAGRRPDLLTWVRRYGEAGATLVPQPDLIWTHGWADFLVRDDGSACGVLPLWTSDESPSDLSVEFEIDPDGVVTLTDLHVL
jgi:hypothetical protein